MRVWTRSFDAGALENAREGRTNSANAPATPSGAARGHLREGEGGRWFASLALAYRLRDAPLQFFKISNRYHRTSKIISEFSRNPNGAWHKGHMNEIDAEETAAAIEVAARIEVDRFREFWLASGRLGSSTYANCEWRKVSHAERQGFWSWLAPAGSIPERTMLESGYATGVGSCCRILSCNGPASPSIATPGKGMRGSAY